MLNEDPLDRIASMSLADLEKEASDVRARMNRFRLALGRCSWGSSRSSI